MMVSRLKIGAAAAALAYLAASPGAALAGKCSSGETKAAGKKASCKAGVLSKAAAKNLAPDAGKLAACDTKFSAGFTKAQSAGGCPSSETAGQMETTVDNFVNDLNSEIAVGPLPSKCQAAKLKAAGKKAGCKLGVQAKGLAKDIAPDPGKLQACSDKFAAAFAKAETGTTCGAAANATTIENKVDAFMNDVVNTLNPPASCCGFPGAGPTRLSFTTGIGSGNC